jgi:uncharacterized protein (UPF0333 family)
MSKIFEKKGQAALEFLTTYGWAFMVILVMIGALAYFGVLNPGKLVKDQCTSTAGVGCKSYEVNLASGQMSISFTNNLGQAVTISSVNISTKAATTVVPPQISDANGVAISAANPAVPDAVFMLRNCTFAAATAFPGKKSGDKVKMDFTFLYQGLETGEFSHMASGTLTATAK